MIKFIERLKEKPEKVRQRFAVTITIILTFVIVLVWLTLLYAGSVTLNPEKKSDAAPSPINLFLEEVSGRWNEVQGSFEQSPDSLNENIKDLNDSLEEAPVSTSSEQNVTGGSSQNSTSTSQEANDFQ